MNRPTRTALLLTLTLAAALSTACRVERTSGQRHQARAIDTVLRAEHERLNGEPLSEQTLEDYAHLTALYRDLVNASVRSGEAQPLTVQEAEDEFLRVASEARRLPVFTMWTPEAQTNFEESFWRFRLRPWQQWRGPDHVFE